MSGKIIISVISLILVVGVAIGVVITVHTKGEDSEIQIHKRSLRVVCQNAEDKKFCYETLGSIRGIDAADPKAYIAAAVKAATDNFIKAFNMTDKLTVEYGDKDRHTKMVLASCKDMMKFALDSLNLSTTVVRDKNIQSVHAQNADLRNWLSAVISYNQACMEGFDDENEVEKKIKDQLNAQTIDRAINVTVVALDIVSDLSNILQEFGLKLDLKLASRRLLSEEIDNEKGFPTWVSTTDRKLLAQMEGNNWRSKFKPNVVVAKDGTGQFKTINESINSYPPGFKGRYIIYVKAGVYDEHIIVPSDCRNLLMYGDGIGKTVITGNQSKKKNNLEVNDNASFSNTAIGFIARDMTFQNTAGPEGAQAVALRNMGDMSAFVGCEFVGYQDTLYVQSNRQFYRDCVIHGTVDFIFGMSTTLIQNSKIIIRKPMNGQSNAITADGTDKSDQTTTGIVIQGCEIVAEEGLPPKISYLGRPWKPFSRTVFMESTFGIGDFINPAGWIPWKEKVTGNDIHMDTCYYGEYQNTGPGANLSGRIKWKGYQGLISRGKATTFTAAKWLQANEMSSAVWLHNLDVPHYLRFKKA